MFEVVKLGEINRSSARELPGSGEMDRPPVDPRSLGFTGRVANWSAHHRWRVVAASVLVVVLAMLAMNAVETKTLEYNGEGEAAVGAKLVEDRFKIEPPPTEQVVFNNPSLDASDPAYRTTVTELVQQLRALPEVASVASFYDTGDPSMVSEDGHVVLARLELKSDDSDGIDPILEKVHAAAGHHRLRGRYGGSDISRKGGLSDSR